MDKDEDFGDERKKVHNRRKAYTFEEKKVVLKNYHKTGELRQTATKLDISPSTLQGWILNKDKFTEAKNDDYRLKGGGRKHDSAEYDEDILEFIKEAS